MTMEAGSLGAITRLPTLAVVRWSDERLKALFRGWETEGFTGSKAAETMPWNGGKALDMPP